jgi:hypothetical protein
MVTPRKNQSKRSARAEETSELPTDNDEKEEALREWPTKRMAAARIGKSLSHVNQLVLAGELTAEKDKSGVWRVDPAELELLIPVDQSNTVTAVNQVLQTMQGQQKDLLTKLIECFDMTFQLLHKENSNMRELRAKEQEAHLNAMVATQNALDFSAERQAQIERAKAEEVWKKQAIEMVSPAMGILLSKLSDSPVSPELLQLRGLMSRVSDGEVQALAALSRMKPEEYAAIQRLRGKSGPELELPEEVKQAIAEAAKAEEAATAAAE